MPIADRIRLSVMMFLNYVIWGSWYVTLGAYLTINLKFTGTQAGAVFGTTVVACIISPFFVGLIADRFFASERVLATLHLVGAVLLFFVTKATTFGPVYGLCLFIAFVISPLLRDEFAYPATSERPGARFSLDSCFRHAGMDRNWRYDRPSRC